VRKAFRYVFGGNKLQPGNFKLSSRKLRNRELLVEFRNNQSLDVPFNSIKKLTKLTDKLIIDSNAKTHNELTDLLLLGAERVVISEEIGDLELGLSHAISDKVLTKIDISDMGKTTKEYFVEKIKRLEKLTTIIPRPLLLVTKNRGDLEKFWPLLSAKIKLQYEWWVAPAEGKVINLDSKNIIKVWFVSGDSTE